MLEAVQEVEQENTPARDQLAAVARIVLGVTAGSTRYATRPTLRRFGAVLPEYSE